MRRSRSSCGGSSPTTIVKNGVDGPGGRWGRATDRRMSASTGCSAGPKYTSATRQSARWNVTSGRTPPGRAAPAEPGGGLTVSPPRTPSSRGAQDCLAVDFELPGDSGPRVTLLDEPTAGGAQRAPPVGIVQEPHHAVGELVGRRRAHEVRPGDDRQALGPDR